MLERPADGNERRGIFRLSIGRGVRVGARRGTVPTADTISAIPSHRERKEIRE
jgi:hypothetical protein